MGGIGRRRAAATVAVAATTVSALVLGAAMAGGWGPAAPAAPASAAEATGARTILLSAFGDAAGTFGESQPFVTALQNRVDRSHESAFCQVVLEGEITGQPVVVAVTGTGSDNSGPCAQELLGWYSPGIREVIWSGIGGATPAVGGLYRADGSRRSSARPVMIGDVCISSLSWAYDLHFSSVSNWATGRPPARRYDPKDPHGWWPMKRSSGQAAVPGFQGVQGFVSAPTGLADELLAASGTAVLASRSAGSRTKIARFWPDRADRRPARFFDYRQCAEVSSDDFWHGVTEDALARRYLTGLINAAGLRSRRATPRDVVAFSAMETVPWMSAVARWNKHTGLTIPMAAIRAASNYDMVPLRRDGTPVRGRDGRPLTAMEDIRIGFDDDSAAYAASNAAAAVLRMLQLRAAG